MLETQEDQEVSHFSWSTWYGSERIIIHSSISEKRRWTLVLSEHGIPKTGTTKMVEAKSGGDCIMLSLCLLPHDGHICVMFALPLLYIECTVWSYILHGCLPTL